MPYRPDIVIDDRAGTAVAIAEVKTLSDGSARTATRYMRNLLTHGMVPLARYVMLITAGTGYLWHNPEPILHEAPPDLTFPMERIIRHYLPSDDGATPIGDLVLEGIAEGWLWGLVDGFGIDPEVSESLQEHGFLDAVRDGRVHVRDLA